LLSKDLRSFDLTTLREYPAILPTLRMCCCPPLARDRLVGLAGISKSLVQTMEKGAIPPRMPATTLASHLGRIVEIVRKMLDADIFPWLAAGKTATPKERHRASTIVADRLCGAVADPIVRNAQEKRQLAYIGEY